MEISLFSTGNPVYAEARGSLIPCDFYPLSRYAVSFQTLCSLDIAISDTSKIAWDATGKMRPHAMESSCRAIVFRSR